MYSERFLQTWAAEDCSTGAWILAVPLSKGNVDWGTSLGLINAYKNQGILKSTDNTAHTCSIDTGNIATFARTGTTAVSVGLVFIPYID